MIGHTHKQTEITALCTYKDIYAFQLIYIDIYIFIYISGIFDNYIVLADFSQIKATMALGYQQVDGKLYSRNSDNPTNNNGNNV